MKVNVADFANLSLLDLPVHLQRRLMDAVLVPSDDVPVDVVTMQCRVVLADAATGVRRVVTLVYPSEAEADPGRVSVLDPLGAQLLGAARGDLVEGAGPDGQPSRLRIEEILYQPERSLRANLVVRD